MGNSGKSNGKFGKKQWEIRAKAITLARNICRCFPSFLIALAQIFPLLLPEFPIGFARISHCFFPKFGQKQWTNLGKAMRKLEKRSDIFQAKIMEVWGNFTNWHIIFKKYFLNQIKILKDLASSARIFSAQNSHFPIYLKILYVYRFGRERYEKNRAWYCEQERSKLYLHSTSPLPKWHYRKFNLFYISTLFGKKKLLRKNSQMLQILFSIPTVRESTSVAGGGGGGQLPSNNAFFSEFCRCIWKSVGTFKPTSICHLYRQSFWSTNKILKETAVFECANAIFSKLARCARSHIHRFSQC